MLIYRNFAAYEKERLKKISFIKEKKLNETVILSLAHIQITLKLQESAHYNAQKNA